ncbi:MAG TPA: hypothetical protein VGQ33_21940 [Vicinamibacteria bacterium]|nr:hypothetical protein [Vicinamibacteria bacterium]
MKDRIRGVLLLAAAIAAGGCSDSKSDVAVGRWGGHNAELVVTSAGATARFKCGATGTIGQRLTLDGMSAFDVPGSFVTPVINLGVQPARYVGSVSGSAMTLALSVSGQPNGTFTLGLGTEPNFDVCNF